MRRAYPCLLVAFLVAFLVACGAPGSREAVAPAPTAVPARAPSLAREPDSPPPPRTDLEAFARPLEWPGREAWTALLVTHSRVTRSPRRLWFDKDAVTAALLDHAGGAGFDAAPLVFPPGTVFFAEQLDPDGETLDTEVLVTRDGETPTFLLFDHGGARSRAEVPAACIACHQGDGFFQPMMSFPNEPRDCRLDLDQTWRDVAIARHFLEGYHRGDHVFGPYASMWLSKLRADARGELLTDRDRERFEELRPHYAELLD